MNPPRAPLFDYRTAGAARSHAAAYDRFLDRAAAEAVADRLATVTRRFAAGLLIGDSVPAEIAASAGDWTLARFDRQEILAVGEARFDLAVSIYSLQAINDLLGALVQIRRALKPDGLFLGALFGGGTLKELRDAFAHGEAATLGGISPRVSPFADIRDGGGLLQRAGFALPVADVERLTVYYKDFFALARDLRGHGQTNNLAERSRRFLRRDTLAATLAHYAAHHGENGKLRASFETLYLTGWAPHDSQPQKLRRGTARSRLADALGTTEQTLTDFPKPG